MAARETYKESYRKGALVVGKHLLPDRFPYMKRGFKIVGIEVRAAGTLSDGTEFQDVRVITKEVTA